MTHPLWSNAEEPWPRTPPSSGCRESPAASSPPRAGPSLPEKLPVLALVDAGIDASEVGLANALITVTSSQPKPPKSGGKKIQDEGGGGSKTAQSLVGQKLISPAGTTHSVFGGGIAQAKANTSHSMITLRHGSVEAELADGAGAEESVEIPAASGRGARVLSRESVTVGDWPELTEASVIVSGGRSVGSADQFSVVEGWWTLSVRRSVRRAGRWTRGSTRTSSRWGRLGKRSRSSCASRWGSRVQSSTLTHGPPSQRRSGPIDSQSDAASSPGWAKPSAQRRRKRP